MKTEKIQILLIAIMLLFLNSCGKDDGLEPGKTYIRGQLLEYGSEAPLPNVAMYLQDCEGGLFEPLICTTIDTFYTNAHGEYDYEFVHSRTGNYVCYFEEVAGYFDIEELVVNHGLNELNRYANPFAWIQLHVKNINPVSENDNIRITGLIGGSPNDNFGTTVDFITVGKIRGNRDQKLNWWVTKNGTTKKDTVLLFCPAHDTTFYEILY